MHTGKLEVAEPAAKRAILSAINAVYVIICQAFSRSLMIKLYAMILAKLSELTIKMN